ncbi:MAG: hypothetical protein ACFFAN_12730 [Promethearchaeota archaeon]
MNELREVIQIEKSKQLYFVDNLKILLLIFLKIKLNKFKQNLLSEYN